MVHAGEDRWTSTHVCGRQWTFSDVARRAKTRRNASKKVRNRGESVPPWVGVCEGGVSVFLGSPLFSSLYILIYILYIRDTHKGNRTNCHHYRTLDIPTSMCYTLTRAGLFMRALRANPLRCKHLRPFRRRPVAFTRVHPPSPAFTRMLSCGFTLNTSIKE